MRSAGHILCVCSGLLAFGAAAQTTGSLRGRVIDEVTGAALPGATVQVQLTDTVFGLATDGEGAFHFQAVPTGIHRVQVRFVGYSPVVLDEVWVRAGKAEELVVTMVPAINSISAVEVRAYAPMRLDAITSEPLSVERSLRYPATFFDPARLAMSYAGVASTNDQANHFSVRGNGPSSNAWLLEGAEIVTPNHLTNAGTPSDLPTLTGGGTTILSAQMLGGSRLLTGGMAARYGNALGGIMDLRLRKGITGRRAFTVQAGLIGIDLSTEGPFKTGGKASYVINYRYSTLGLLGAMGVSLGDEAISFQDLAFTVDLPLGERSDLRIFGMGGNSSNRFDRKDSTEWEVDKDSRDIDYTARVGAVGALFERRMGARSHWSTTVALSGNEQQRTMEDIGLAVVPVVRDSAELYERKLSAHTVLRGTAGERSRYRIGLSAVERDVSKLLYGLGERTIAPLVRPYGEWSYSITKELLLDVGMAYAAYTRNSTGVAEPRLALRWTIASRNQLALSMGQRSQVPQLQSFYERLFPPFFDNTDLGPTVAQDASLTFEREWLERLQMRATAFVQHLVQVPVDVASPLSDGSASSMLNTWEGVAGLQLRNSGEGLNSGVELGVDHHFQRDRFMQVNITVLDARYADAAGEWRSSRWNTGVIGNAVVGREWPKQRDGLKRTWGVSGRFNYTGGQRYSPAQSGVLAVVEPYSAQYDPTYRLDLRIYLKRERQGRTGMWSLDLLNATNAQNVAYRYNDRRKGEEVTVYQLGLIPNLSYRIEF